METENIRGLCGSTNINTCRQMSHFRCPRFRREVIRLLDKVFATDADVTALTAQVATLEARVAALEASGGGTLPNVAANAITVPSTNPATANVTVTP